MKKIFFFIIMTLCFTIDLNAQEVKFKGKEFDSAIKNLENINKVLRNQISTLKDSCYAKKQDLDKAKARLQKFIPVNSSEGIKRLISDKTLSELFSNPSIFRQIENHNSSDLAKSYLELYKMNKSLSENGGYDAAENKAFIKDIPDVRKHILDEHKEEFEEIVNCINDYEFTIQELLRVFKLVDDDSNVTYRSLQDDYEVVYIEKIEYTKKLLEKYLQPTKFSRKKIREEIQNCIKTIE